MIASLFGILCCFFTGQQSFEDYKDPTQVRSETAAV